MTSWKSHPDKGSPVVVVGLAVVVVTVVGSGVVVDVVVVGKSVVVSSNSVSS